MNAWRHNDESLLKQFLAQIQSRHENARRACKTGRQWSAKSGGWCLEGRRATTVKLPLNHSYRLPPNHKPADGIIVGSIYALLTNQLGSNVGAGPWRSLIDFGAGVGQIGHTLLSIEPRLQYRGFDGAGNVEAFTRGFITFTDLSIPLAMPRADWVSMFEVGEHVPSSLEMMIIRNVHAMNCEQIMAAEPRVPEGHSLLRGCSLLRRLPLAAPT